MELNIFLHQFHIHCTIYFMHRTLAIYIQNVVCNICFDAFNNGTQHFTTQISHTIYFMHHTQAIYSKCSVQQLYRFRNLINLRFIRMCVGCMLVTARALVSWLREPELKSCAAPSNLGQVCSVPVHSSVWVRTWL